MLKTFEFRCTHTKCGVRRLNVTNRKVYGSFVVIVSFGGFGAKKCRCIVSVSCSVCDLPSHIMYVFCMAWTKKSELT